MGVKWTDDQQKAIGIRGGSLLVSAAAGSGKTAVLVERVMRRLTDEKDPRDIDEFLIVTYTNAAAAEMRYKFAQAIEDRLWEDPNDRRLSRQLKLLYHASIMTVHSFCLNFLRENFQSAGLSPDFRIADASELLMIKESSIGAVLERAYGELSARPEFSRLVDAFSGMRGDRQLQEVVLSTFEKLQSHPFPGRWMEKRREDFENAGGASVERTTYGAYLFERALATVRGARRFSESALLKIENDPILREKYAPAFENDLGQLDELLGILRGGSWDKAVLCAQGFSFQKLSPVRKFPDEELLAELKASRDACKKMVSLVREKYLPKPEAEIKSELLSVSGVASELFRLVALFDEEFSKEKRRRNLVDFADLEHLAAEILCQSFDPGTGEAVPSEAALAVASRYAEVLVDEYQDTNEVQDLIFRLVSKGSLNLFMVGDVKQSIYRFRLADPSIFLKKLGACADAEDAGGAGHRRVVLSKNFRSRGAVLDAVNFFFSRLMTGTFGELLYDEKERLYQGAEYENEDDERYRTELLLLDMKAPEDSNDEEEDVQKIEAEACLVAGRIEGLLSEPFMVTDADTKKPRQARPSDVVVLLRSAANKAGYFKKALEQRGIAASFGAEGGFFERTEILVMLSLLSVIDNPRKDVELVSVMRSPLYGFSEDELADIRLGALSGDFLDAVRESAKAGNEKCRRFLCDIEDFRGCAADMSVSRLLFHIYNKTGALGLLSALSPGAEREKNLLALFEYAGDYERLSYKGLHSFLSYMEKTAERGEVKKAEENPSDAVTIMSIHKSKGLEFPIVFLSDCAKQFNEDDLKRRVLLHPKLGVGLFCIDPEGAVEYPTLMRLSVEERLRQEMLAEELRILYVGMTRAKEKLILTMALPCVSDSMKKGERMLIGGRLDEAVLSQQRSAAMWLLLPILGDREQTAVKLTVVNRTDLAPSGRYPEEQGKKPEPPVSKEEIGRALSFAYPFSRAASLPSKLTPTQLNEMKPGIPPEAENTEMKPQKDGTGSTGGRKAAPKPYFLEGERPLNFLERGIAHHLVMQFIDFSKGTAPDGVEEELARLESRGFLSAAQRKAVDKRKILAFFRSDTGRRLYRSDDVRREFRFSVLMPPDDLLGVSCDEGDPSRILLQGVVDCMFKEDGGLVIIDFKTDRIGGEAPSNCAARYRAQLEAYARAMECVTGLTVKETVLWFFDRDLAVSVKREKADSK